MKKKMNEKINLSSLVSGIFLIIIGLGVFSIITPSTGKIIFVPISLLILGTFFALMGGLRKWG